MLYALGDPLSFLLLVVSFVVAVTAHGWISSVAADRFGDRRPRNEGRCTPDPRRHVDPFGAIGGLIAGVGWARPVEVPARAGRGQLLAVTLCGPGLNLLLGVLSLLAFRALSPGGLAFASVSVLQHGLAGPVDLRATALFGLMNLYVGVLSVVPLPPLDGGRLLFGLAPRGLGWQKAAYHLIERNIGIAVLLVLLLLPLGGPQALLPAVLDRLVGPLARLVTGG